MSRRRYGGKLFHTHGPAALKLRSPKLLCKMCIRGTRHVLAAAERSWRRSMSVTSWMSSAMYAGVWPARDWCTRLPRHVTLYSTRWRTDSQCSWRSTGVMWSHRRAPVTWPDMRRRSGWTEPYANVVPSFKLHSNAPYQRHAGPLLFNKCMIDWTSCNYSVLPPRLGTGLGNAAWCTATAGDRSLGFSSVASPCVSRIDFAVNY